MKLISDPFEEGVRAYSEGEDPRTACPYPKRSDEAIRFWNGWSNQQEADDAAA